MVLLRKKIVGVSNELVNIFSFDISPYEIIPSSMVYRRDLLPTLSSGSTEMYQRPLISRKINAIRKNLLNTPNFIFPNSILVVLSEESTYTRNQLIIPRSADSISIIDGQHRLFSYANQDVEDQIGENSRIMVTAIQLPNGNREEIIRLSAQAFVEINQNQTRITSTHIDSIGYDILGNTDPRALSAKVLLTANMSNRSSALFCLFRTNQTAMGHIQPGTVITYMKPIFNLQSIERLTRLRETTSRYSSVIGYFNLFNVDNLGELLEPDRLISRGVSCILRYFNIIRSEFRHDWPTRERENHLSSFYYSKFIAAWMSLLKEFIDEGQNWDGVLTEIQKIKNNILLLREISDYNNVLFLPSNELIPDANISVINDFRFYHKVEVLLFQSKIYWNVSCIYNK